MALNWKKPASYKLWKRITDLGKKDIRKSADLKKIKNYVDGELQPPEGGGFNLRLESRLSC